MSPTSLNQLLDIKYPIIQAPMFLVSNTAMVIEAMKSGIAGCIPALNYETIEELRIALKELNAAKVNGGSFGFILIVNKSNKKHKEQLAVICEEGCDFIMTSLGSPEETIYLAHKFGIKVFCDVMDLQFAKEAEALGIDAVVGVNNKAGGYRGQLRAEELIKNIVSNCNIPIISAGGVGCKDDMKEMMDYGAAGVSIGSLFIASNEAKVSQSYKVACVVYGADDIVMTERIFNTPSTIINTPHIQLIQREQSWIESILNINGSLKKWVNSIRYSNGERAMKRAVSEITYKTVWVAGPSIEHTNAILPTKEIISKLVN
jgi:nitronate monooxygenase